METLQELRRNFQNQHLCSIRVSARVRRSEVSVLRRADSPSELVPAFSCG